MSAPYAHAAQAGSPPDTGTLTGTVLGKDGRTMAGGKLLIFRDGQAPPPLRSKYWRTPDDMIDIGADGTFSARLIPGNYYIAALKKSTNDLIGPPQENDLVYPDSRAELKKEQQLYVVKKGEVTDAGLLAEAVPYRKGPSAAGVTEFEGTIVDSNGMPVVGAVALAYRASDMIGKPLFISERTGKDGKYVLRVGEKGTYYLKTRSTLTGGKPIEGEIIGVYNQGKPVSIDAGEIIKGIDIKGSRFVIQKKRPEEQRMVQ